MVFPAYTLLPDAAPQLKIDTVRFMRLTFEPPHVGCYKSANHLNTFLTPLPRLLTNTSHARTVKYR